MLLAKKFPEPAAGVGITGLSQTQCSGDYQQHEVGITNGREVDEPDSGRKGTSQSLSSSDSQARFTHATRTSQGDEADGRIADERGDLGDFAVPADQKGERGGKGAGCCVGKDRIHS